MPKKRRDAHGFFRLDNTSNGLLKAIDPPPLFLCKCSFQTSLRSELLQAFVPEAARVLVLQAAEGLNWSGRGFCAGVFLCGSDMGPAA
jgi:hypothetical protein